MSKGIGLIGYGYWGPKLARCLNKLEALQCICDLDEKKRASAFEEWNVETFSNLNAFFSFPIDAVAIATPPENHYEVAKIALEAGKDVFIEKPMTTSYREAVELANLATQKGLSLMVGHIYLHNGGIKAMPIPVGKAELYVRLLNEAGAPSPSARDPIWAGLPHAVSLALRFFPDGPESIDAKRRDDRIKVHLKYWNGSEAYLDLADYAGRKERIVELRVGNTRYCFDTKNPEGYWKISGVDEVQIGFGKEHEPLLEECKAFLDYKGVDPIGPKVVRLIEEIKECLKSV